MILRVVLFMLLACPVVGFSQEASNPKPKKPLVLFTVNKKPVTADEFIYQYKKNPSEGKDAYSKEKIEEYLHLFINFKLKVEEARKRGMDTTASFRQEFNQYREELLKPYLPGNNITDSLAKASYERMKEEVRASHILIGLKPDAAAADTLEAYNRILSVRKRLLSGEDFGKVAVEVSEDPSAKMNNGDLGYFTALQMVYPFEEAAYRTTVGEVSQPLRTRFGYHLLKVSDRRPSRGEVEVSHIMVRHGEVRTEDEAKNLIFNIYDQLQAGEKWEELTSTHSEDLSTKDRGGRLSRFGTGAMSSVPEFEKVAFELSESGQISDPFQTQYGWHIVRLEQKHPLAPFEELAPGLKSKISRDERVQVSRQALQQKLRRANNYTENVNVKSQLLATADSTLRKGQWRSSFNPKQILFSLGGKQWPVSGFIDYVYSNQKANTQAPANYLAALYDQYVDQKVAELQEERISASEPSYRYLLSEYYEGILNFEILEKEVWNKASDDSVGQRRYYEQNKTAYKAGNRVKASIYSSSSEQVLDELKELIAAGDQNAIQEHTSSRKVRSESGYFEKSEKAVLQKIPWEKGVFGAGHNGMFYLIWTKEVLPEGLQSFEEARISLISDYQTHLEKVWVAELRKKYPVKVNAKAKKVVVDQLLQNNKP